MKHEKELLAYPVPKPPRVALPGSGDGVRHLWFAAQVARFKDMNALGITVFYPNGKPMRRWWVTPTQDGMQSFETVKNQYNTALNRVPGRMYEAGIGTELDIGCCWCSTVTVLVGTKEDERRALAILGKRGTSDVGQALRDVQADRREKKRLAEQEKRKVATRARFAALPAEPEGFDDWIENSALRPFRWFYYEYTGRKAQEGVCTHCGAKSKLEGVHKGAEVECPKCRSLLTCRSWKTLPLNGLRAQKTVALYQPAGDELAVRVYCVGIKTVYTFNELVQYAGHNVWKREEYRYFLTGDGKLLNCAYSSAYGRYSLRVDGFQECGPDYGYYDVTVCPIGLEGIRKGMGLYTPVEDLARKQLTCTPEALFAMLWDKPELEYLVKLGLYRLAEDLMRRDKPGTLLKGKTPTEILGVDKQVLREMQQANPGAWAVQVIRALVKCGITTRAQDMADIERLELSYGCSARLERMAGELSLHKALAYVSRQIDSRADGEDVLQMWDDYVGMARELGIDLQDGMRLFPRKLRVAHDEAAKLLKLRRDAQLDLYMKRTADGLEDLAWQSKTMLIRPAVSQGELFCEGKALQHCVGRAHYAQSMAEGKTAIFFIRKVKEPDVPYVTLELDLKTWQKKQCYGARDKWPGETVDKFVKNWLENVVRPARIEDGAQRIRTGVKTA